MTKQTDQTDVYVPGKTYWYFESTVSESIMGVLETCVLQKTDFSVEFLSDGKVRIEVWPRRTSCLMTTVSF